MNKNLVKIISFAVVLICGVLLGLIISQQSFLENKLYFLNKNILSPKEAGEKVLNYIDENVLKGSDLKASLVEGSAVEEKNGVYEMKLKIEDSEFTSYLTKDGKLLFPEAIELVEEIVSSEEPTQQQKTTCEDIKKEPKPILEAFVVSYCPFGTQMQRILAEIVKNIPELAENIRIEYMGQISGGKVTSMHGEEEAEENLTQICLREEQKDKFFPYLACFLKKGEGSKCLSEVSVDQGKVQDCKSSGSRGLAYAQRDFDLQDKYKITGSPTLILNGQKVSEFDFGGRTAEAGKTLLCCGFENEFSSCQKTLAEEEAATGFSETYSSGQSGSGSCN